MYMSRVSLSIRPPETPIPPADDMTNRPDTNVAYIAETARGRPTLSDVVSSNLFEAPPVVTGDVDPREGISVPTS